RMHGTGIHHILMDMKRSEAYMAIFEDLTGLIQKAQEVHLFEKQDEVYVRNQVHDLLNIKSFPNENLTRTEDTIPNLLEKLIAYAIDHGVIEDIFDDKEILSAKIMNCFGARPSVVNNTFYEKYNKSPEAATD